MPSTPKLTARQQEILELIERSLAQRGVPPTRAEISEAFGFSSANAAQEHLRALARKGVIELTRGTARGIRLTRSALKRLGHSPGTLSLPGMEQLALPLIGRVAAGAPILAQEHVSATYHLAPTLFRERPDYLLKVRGMSMRDAGIIDGDLLAVRSTREARNGQIVVARLHDEVTVKRLRRSGGSIVLRAENPDFADIPVHPGDDFAIEGLPVGLVRPQV